MSAGSNQFGRVFKFNSFGESHGPAMGVVIDGCLAGVQYDEALLLKNLASRKPGQAGTTARSEHDQPEILSGIFENKTLGTPIAVIIRNKDQRSGDYDKIKNEPRTGHADDVWEKKFGHRDHRGGGRASARETLNWVVAGSFAQMLLNDLKDPVKVQAQLVSVGGQSFSEISDPKLQSFLQAARDQGESYGAVVRVIIQNPSAGLGEPVFLKLKSELARAFMCINACTGVELGGGFDLAHQKGSDTHKDFHSTQYGGIRGGISTGEDISFRLAFKPTSSIGAAAREGRHDPCVALRALPIAQAMAFNVLADFKLIQRLNRVNEVGNQD